MVFVPSILMHMGSYGLSRRDQVLEDVLLRTCRFLIPLLLGSGLIGNVTLASTPPLKDLNSFSRGSMPRRKIAAPAAMVMKSGLVQKP